MDDRKPNIDPRLVQGFDKLLSVQRPAVLAHIRAIRRRHPGASPDQLIRILERRYLAAVTTGGAAVGASAVIPGVGTAASLGLSGVETVVFLEASALFAQSVTEVHGISVVEPERASSLVMAMMLGSGGQELVRQLAGQFAHSAPARPVFWGELITSSLPKAVVGQVTDKIKRTFLKHFAARQAGSILGRTVPFGVGAAVGGIGNHMLGRRVVDSSRQAFGPAPLTFRAELDSKEPAEKRSPRLRLLSRKRNRDAEPPPPELPRHAPHPQDAPHAPDAPHPQGTPDAPQ